MRRNFQTKEIALFFIALFIGLAIAPGIHAEFEKNNSRSIVNSTTNKLIKLTVSEYKSDGTIEKKIIELPQDKLDELNDRLKDVKDEDEKLSIYKEYRLIPQNVTSEKLRAGMEEKAKIMSLTKKNLEKIRSAFGRMPSGIRNYFIMINFVCAINVEGAYSLYLRLGVSFFTSRVNYLLWILADVFGLSISYLPSIDLIDTGFIGLGNIATWGGLGPDKNLRFNPMFGILAGFVGYCIRSPLRIQFMGYAAFVFAIGLPWDY